MQHDELIKLLMSTFLEELEEQVQALDRDLLSLERDPAGTEREAILRVLFRTVHSVKGAARVVDVGLVGNACHHMEELIQLAQAGVVPASWFQLMLAASDAIRDAGLRIRRGETLEGSPLAAIGPQLERAALLGAPVTAGGEPTATTPDGPDGSRARAEAATMPRPAPAAAAVAATIPADPAGAPADQATGAVMPAPGERARAIEAPSVRVPAEKLDALLVRVGELVLASRRSEQLLEELDTVQDACRVWLSISSTQGSVHGARDAVRNVERKLEHIARRAAASQRALENVVRAAEDDVHRLRLLPFGVVCLGLERTVRDLAQESGKNAELVVEGADIGIDRGVLDALRDPLLHLVRNAVEHGVEGPDVRRAAGKRERARVTVSAALLGSQVQVVVADDGRGLDIEAIRSQARRRGLRIPADERELAQVVFLPGFSTAKAISTVSGRGVGLDVVKSQVEASHGNLQLLWDPQRGTRFVINVPLTVTTIRVLLVSVAGQLYAVPVAGILALRRVAPEDVHTVEGRQTVAHQGQPMAVVPLATALGLRAEAAIRPDRKVPGLVLASGGKQVVVLVDQLIGEQDILVKTLGRRIRRLKHMSGATLLATGRIAFVLHTPEVVRTALARGPEMAFAEPTKESRTRILLAEDSLTTRTLEKTILEAAGYEVLAASDGAEAWQLLNDQGADLVVSDVEMPRMDGFTLAETIRGSKRFRHLPVILVTSLDRPEHKQRGADAGADAYLVKSAFDQSALLELIRQLT